MTTLIEPPTGAALLTRLDEDGYTAAHIDGDSVHVLMRRNQQLALYSRNFVAAESHMVPLDEDAAGGPLYVNGRICVYSAQHLHVQMDGGWKKHPFRQQARAILHSREIPSFRRPPGMLPWVVSGDGIYLPAEASGQSGFTYMSLAAAGGAASAFLELARGAAYSRDAVGQLVVSAPCRMYSYRSAGNDPVLQDQQLSPRGAEYFDKPLAVYFARIAGAGEVLRFRNAETYTDSPLPTGTELDPIRIQPVGGAFVLTFFFNNTQLGMVVWHV